MSQLNVDTLKDRTGADQPDIVGAAKAWVQFDGSGTVSIGDELNVDSITDNGTGDYTITFTTALPNANYAITACLFGNTVSSATALEYRGVTSSEFSVLAVFCTPTSSGVADNTSVSLSIFSN